MIVVIDNYDSFVHNLARYVREAGHETLVVRNDSGSAEALLQIPFDAVVVSPGPKTPAEAGASLPFIRRLSLAVPLLGVCLGHQCLVEAFGGRTVRAKEPLHGEASLIRHDGEGLFAGIENPTSGGRYHSLVSELPEGGPLRPCAWSERGELMATRHERAPWFGLQFHPESLLTPAGRRIIANFLECVERRMEA